MSSIDSLLKSIEEGKKGRNIGISTGLHDLDKVIYGIQKRYLYVLAGDTSSGKSSAALDIFVYNALKNANGRKINILYYSFEMSSDVLFAKLLSRYIWDIYKKVITFEDILSLTETISDESYNIIQECKPWLEYLAKQMTIYDKPLNPNAIYATCKEWLRKFGTFIPINEHREDYSENDSTEYKIVIVDHCALISGQGSKKERIDTTVNYLIHFRNKCNITGVLIQQLNRGLKSLDRRTKGYELVQLDDFKETSDTTDGAEVVLALYYPYREKIASCEGYPIKDVLKHRARIFQVIKNRFGRSDINKGVTFHGEIGMFRELPKPDEILNYEKYIDLFYDESKQIIDKNEEDDINTDVFKL